MNLHTANGLSIGELSRRTGIGVSTIRAWEARYGFPTAERLPGGHRRYTERDVTALQQVARERAAGATLGAALVRTREAATAPRASLMAAVRDEVPHAATVVLTKVAMLAMSRAIEDEALSRATDGLLVGAFQREVFWRSAEPRWRHLADRSRATVALATFPRRRVRKRLWEMPLTRNTPLRHEWAVICDSPTFSACVVAVDTGASSRGVGRTADRRRLFEAVWTVEPRAVRRTARNAIDLVADDAPGLSNVADQHFAMPLADTSVTVRNATTLTNRMMRYIDLVNRRR